MKLVVLGATGGTGLEIVRQAIQRGHSVTAMVRSTERLNPFRDHVVIRQGNLLDAAELEEVIGGHDAVLSAFGPRVPVSRADAHLLEQFAVALTHAMRRAEVKRIAVESVAFLFKNSIFPPAYLLGRLLFPRTVADASALERILQASGLEWTIVRPPELTDKAYTGRYRVKVGHLPSFGFAISRADVAEFMLRTIEDHSTIGKIIGVSN